MDFAISFGGICAVAVVVVAWVARRRLAADPLVWARRTPRLVLDRVRDGDMVRIVGVVARVPAPLTSPETKRACACWKRERSAAHDVTLAPDFILTETVTKVTEEALDATDFTCAIDGGVLIAIRATSVVLIISTHRVEGGSVREGVIAEGDRIAVVGRATHEDGRLVIAPSIERGLLITDAVYAMC